MFVRITLFCFIAYLVSFSYSEVLRLPCRRHGNFSLRHKEKHMTEVTVLDTLSIPTVADCVLRCIGHDTCQNINYQYDVKSCQLLDEGEGTLVNKTNSEYLTTETDTENHGPFCKSVSPCTAGKDCFDSCDALGYRCDQIALVLEKNKVVKTLPFLSKTWILSFDVLLLSISSSFTNLVHATTNLTYGVYGGRVPQVVLFPQATAVAFRSAVSGNSDYGYDHQAPLQMNVYTNIQITQVLEGEDYVFKINVGGKNVHKVVNTKPSNFANVTLYASSPSYDATDAVIKNLNFDFKNIFKIPVDDHSTMQFNIKLNKLLY